MTNVHLCPKCGGQGIVTKPPWLPGDVPSWVSHTTAPYKCNLCEGRKFIEVTR
jgi:hypothetical protein